MVGWLPAFRAFVKPASGPAAIRCELKASRLEIGTEGDSVTTAYLEVAPTFAYESVIVPALKSGKRVQIGVEFKDGRRFLLTGRVEARMPTVSGTEVVQVLRMDVARIVRSQRGGRARGQWSPA